MIVYGRRLPLSPARRFISDMMIISRGIPVIPIERPMNVGPLVAARARLQTRPGWCAIFTKAYAFVAARHPELRRSYVSFPWPHLYEHPINVGSISLEREFGNEMGVLVGHIRAPENHTLLALDEYLRQYKTEPLHDHAHFRRILRVCGLPWFLRRFAWWWGANSSGRRRARHFGTFGVSSVSGWGAGLLCVLSPLSTILSYGKIDRDGNVDVRVSFDHRVLDGAMVARFLKEMEQVLNREILQELLDLRGLSQSA